MSAFVWFRFPKHKAFYELKQTHGEPKEFSSTLQLEGEEGFVFAPFNATKEQPIFVIQAHEVSEKNINQIKQVPCQYNNAVLSGNEQGYKNAFNVFHTALKQQRFQKIVLSRAEKHSSALTPAQQQWLFALACKTYPQLFIALIHIPKIGTWLMATPETLIKETPTAWKTMALAATQKSEKICSKEELKHTQWGEKEKAEQQWVARYIETCLQQAHISYSCTQPYTTQAAQLLHLRTDFSFHITTQKQLLHLINSLHPTPAVCGLPKEQATHFILKNEGYNRKYYSGFAGLFNVKNFTTHLFVTLRCMEIEKNSVSFYAGGGLLTESEEESEWQETQNKMQTIKKLFY